MKKILILFIFMLSLFGVFAIITNNSLSQAFINFTTTNQYFSGVASELNISNAQYNGNNFSVAAQETTPQGLTFNSDGSKVFIVGSAQDKIFEYDCSTNYDITSCSYSSNSFSVAAQEIA